MKKLLHERLRELADKNEELYSGFIIEALCKEFGVCEHNTSYAVDLCNCLKAIADEIEKYYIPRPRFEDGEPVQFGDRFVNFRGEENSTISSLTYTKGNNDYVNINGWHKQNLNEPVYRCKPKILDADGVEIKVGDVVWPINNPEMKMVVDNFQRIYGQDMTANCEFEGEYYNFDVDKLTHREPDSLKKLHGDMLKWLCRTAHQGEAVERWANRLAAIMERDA